MVIDVNLLARQGKELEDFSFDLLINQDLVLAPETELVNGKIQGTIYLEDKIYVKGIITFIVKGACSRCLEPANELVEVDFDEVFSQRPVDDEYGYKSGKVDLTEMVNDKILSNQPSVLLCNENCKGLCPKCGCNLNLGGCSCEK